MTIHDYINKRGLTKWRTGGADAITQDWLRPFFTRADSGESSHGDQFEIYANADHTLFVSLNTSRDRFRIIHYDLILFCSKWESMRPGLDYQELRAL